MNKPDVSVHASRFNRRVLIGMSLLPALTAWIPGLAWADKLPLTNLLVEWRMVSSAQAQQRQQAVRDGGYTVSTVDQRADQRTVHGVMVLNGGQARLYMGRTVPQTTWQFVYSPNGAQSSQSNQGGTNSGNAQLMSQTTWVDLGQGLVVHPSWTGGNAPVRIQIEAQTKSANVGSLSPQGLAPDGQVQRQEVQSTLLVSMGQWFAVAQSRNNTIRSGRGTWSTSDIDDQGADQLEIRITQP